MAFRIGMLEMHAAHACNLTCESCAHFSNNGHMGVLNLDEAEASMRSWHQRLAPVIFQILGGEPTLNPHLPELVELAAHYWPTARIGVTTNGFYLHRHPRLPAVLSKHKAALRLTIHHQSAEYLSRVREIVELLNAWRQQHTFQIDIEKAYDRWTRRHHGFGAGVLPYEDEDPRKSWEQCPCKRCMQLFRGRLWKCSPIAYLHLQKEAYPDISPKWDSYLTYAGLAADCSDSELRTFLQREDEAICGMCAASPEPFEKPSPLIPLGVLKQQHALRQR